MNLKKKKLSPSIPLKDIYGSSLILNPRASFSKYGWLPESQAQLDFLTAAPLTIAGNLPVICSHSVCTKKVIAFLSKANLHFTPNRYSFSTSEEYEKILKLIDTNPKKMVVNHPHPQGEIQHHKYWIDPEIIGFLNNKANLTELVPKGYTPQRLIIPPDDLFKAYQTFKKFPLVVKAATAEPNGGGYDVIICNHQTDLEQARKHLRRCHRVVLEEFVELKENYCVQFAITKKGSIIYLGTSEQITDDAGIYKGNWLFREDTTPEIVTALARSITEKASTMGYHGICGIDIILSKDSRPLVIDLNFRLNGSTPALLLKESIFSHHESAVLLFRNWKSSLQEEEFFSVCNEAIEQGHLLPLAVYDPTESSYGNEHYFFSGILLGNTKDEICQKERDLFSRGII